MIDDRINKTLSELESNLRNIESARKQVEDTVKSYDGLRNVTTDYVNTLSAVNDNLNKLVDLVGEDYASKVRLFENDRKSIIDSCNAAIDAVNSSARDVSTQVKENIRAFHKKFVYVLVANAITIITIIILFFVTK